MEQPCKAMIDHKLQQLLDGIITRESVNEWAEGFIINDDKVDIIDLTAWHYLVDVSVIAEMTDPVTYLYTDEDIKELMKSYE